MASTPDALKSFLTSVIPVVSLQDALGCPSRRQQVTLLLNVAIANVTDEANLHAKIAPDTATTKDLERKLEHLARARDWLGDQPPIKDISAELNRESDETGSTRRRRLGTRKAPEPPPSDQ